MQINKLHIKVNLDKQEIDNHSILCPTCDFQVETIVYMLFSCLVTCSENQIDHWLDIDISSFTMFSDMISWVDHVTMNTIRGGTS